MSTDPKENLLIEDFIKKNKYSKLTDLVKVSDGNHMSISEKFIDNGVPYYRGQDIHSFFIEGANPNCIDTDTFNLPVMKRSHLKKGDVLLSIVGTIGKLGLVTTDNKATCSCKLAILRPSKIIAEFLSVFLASKYGQNQIQKFKRGAVQMGLILEDFDQLLIPYFDDTFQSQIETLVKNAHSKLEQSRSSYTQAETLLLETLGLADFSPSIEKVNIKSFKDSFAATGRLDAEYYQPKFDQLEAKLTETHTLHLLSDFLTINQRGTQPDYAEEEGLPVINSKHVREGEVILSDNRLAKIPDKESPLLIKKGDVLINGTGVGTIGRAAPYLHDQQAIPDNHVTVLRTDKLNPIYLAVYLNSIAGKYQVDKYFKGSSGQIELYPTDIDKFYVPFVNESIQTQIAALVQESFTLKAESEHLLDAAKRAVEIAIETDEQAAMAYLESQT
ncbi:restriction endonuclease subunit S [Methyloglobulus sp.]|uniref:restriction endonuclease subunit S n=1 Tax=Methyloglobulus sp. TaxID=2518622 RepID=UPI0032B73190